MDNDRGSVSIFFIIITLAVVAATGLVVDGGRKMTALAEARDLADNAARACAQNLDTTLARTGVQALDAPAAVAAGQGFLSATGRSGTVGISPADDQECVVTVSIDVDNVFLPGSFTVSSTQTARGLSLP